MRGWIAVFFVFLFFTGCSAQSKTDDKGTKSLYLELEKKYGISIVFEQLEKKFPAYWLEPPILVTYEPLVFQDLSEIYKPIKDALSQYPSNVIKKNLRYIGLAKKLYFYGAFYGATYTQTDPERNSIFLSKDSDSVNLNSYEYIFDSIHHEFSSILMKRYPFPEAEWRQANTKTFRYKYEDQKIPGLEAMKNQEHLQKEESPFVRGFMSDYGMSSLEEDVNVFSGVLFAYPDWMIDLASKHAIIRKKIVIWLKFYTSIDPAFNNTPLFKKYASKGLKP